MQQRIPNLAELLPLVTPKLFQPNDISCLPTAFAIAMQMSPRQFIDSFDDDFNAFEIPDALEDLATPLCYRGYTLNDCSIKALRLGWCPTFFDQQQIEVRLSHGQGIEKQWLRQQIAYLSQRCVITFETSAAPHSVAVLNNMLYDPAVGVYKFNPFRDEFPLPILQTIVLNRMAHPSAQYFHPIHPREIR